MNLSQFKPFKKYSFYNYSIYNQMFVLPYSGLRYIKATNRVFVSKCRSKQNVHLFTNTNYVILDITLNWLILLAVICISC